MTKTFYITTPIYYVNSDPHIGSAYTTIAADILARWNKLLGGKVFFLTGTDEHGQKIWEKAQEAEEDTQAYVDRHAESVKKLKKVLNLSYDNFVRTTDEHHKKAAQELWRRCEASGDIDKRKYKGLYCVGCEKFLQTRDLDEDGKCPFHPSKDPIELEEENYFFKLSKYQNFLEEYLRRPDVIIPLHRLEEPKRFVANGLEDFSISREKEKLPWGVPVPNDDDQVMYVWFDALTNYISTLGWPEDSEGKFQALWQDGDTLQIAGKDQIRFQSIMWPAMLKSAGIEPPDRVFYHGFINSGGQRMSKSIGNVISPNELVEKYGTDATRYLLLRHVHPFDDTDVTWERLDEWYTANLVNGLGNLVARVMKLAETHLDAPIVRPEAGGFPKEYTDRIDEFRMDQSLDYVWRRIGDLDEKITATEPFKLVKEDEEKGKTLIAELAQELYLIGRLLNSFMPETNMAIKEAVLANEKPENLFPRLR